jgi:2-polyprenyl-6-methoxyphenol hydroxylase-like FAD-dependent oxidoreductase
MTPDVGLGANLAIENVVALANILHRELASDRTRHLSQSEVTKLFEEYQSDRYEKVKTLVEYSGTVTRIHSQETEQEVHIVRNVLPNAGPAFVEQFTNIIKTAPKLDYAPNTLINETASGWAMEPM